MTAQVDCRLAVRNLGTIVDNTAPELWWAARLSSIKQANQPEDRSNIHGLDDFTSGLRNLMTFNNHMNFFDS